jgi:hypothetical protein
MNTMFYVLCIVAVVFAADSYQKYLKMKHASKSHDPEHEDSLKKNEMLEDRIRVLERIVTESKHDLGREIDSL